MVAASNLKKIIPPIVMPLLLRLGFSGITFKYGFKSWSEAEARCSGYDDKNILQAITESSRKVRDGKAAFDRDGVAFQSAEYSWPLLSAILGTPRESNSISVLDWGGALGSTYRQNKTHLDGVKIAIKWKIVEQKRISDIGVAEFQSLELSFAESLKDLTAGQFDLAILASSVCYVSDPAGVIAEIVDLSPKRIVFDRTPESRRKMDQIGVQNVSSKIYTASYPLWAFAPGTLEKLVGPRYKLTFDWISEFQPDPQTIAKGYCFDRID
jgi:putative methyltransferase (TIGR04325 family)